jgi:hypothetical protein
MKSTKMPLAKWGVDNLVLGDAPIDKNLAHQAINEIAGYMKGGNLSSKYDDVGVLADTANKWFGTSYKSPFEAHQSVVGYIYKNLIAAPKFLLSMNPLDLFMRAAQNGTSPEDMGMALSVWKKAMSNWALSGGKESVDIAGVGQKYIRSGNEDIPASNEWRASDKGMLRSFLGPEIYTRVGKFYNFLPNLVERQEISNNRMILLWNLERGMREAGKMPVGDKLAVETMDAYSEAETKPIIQKALSETFEQQGRLGNMLGRSKTGADLGMDKNSGENLAFLYGRMFANYPLATANNIIRTMRRISESGDMGKIKQITPIVMLAATGALTMGVPAYLAAVERGEKPSKAKADFVMRTLKEFQMPSALFPFQMASDLGTAAVETLKGNALPHGKAQGALKTLFKQTSGPLIPGVTVYNQLSKLFGGKK